MSDNTTNPQLNELVSFIQHSIPGLEDGEYRVQVAQQVKDASGNAVSDDSLTITNSFAVAGDRFGLKKPGEILYSVFPAADADGKFNAVLPSVVFTKATFPWSRYPTKTLDEEYGDRPPAGQDCDQDLSTWLAVMLLDEDDIAGYAGTFPGFALEPKNATIGDLFSINANPQSTLQQNYSYFYGVNDQSKPLTTYMDAGDQLTDNILVLDMPLPLFWKIAPTINDLKVMAHVRKVSLINKPTMPGISDVGSPEGSFSIVFGNRLPGPGKKNYAYLVSLEELEDFLPTNEDGGTPTNADGFQPDSAKMLRLAVLTSWTFHSTEDSAGFVNRLNALNNAAPATSGDVNADLSANANLRLSVPANALPIVKNALNMGYVPLNHNLRTGEITATGVNVDKTVSWYRGPLTPYQVAKSAINLPIASPDQITIFDPSTGMLDMSYGAAWTLGRQMALQDTGFATALYNWKKSLTLDLVNTMENQILSDNFSRVFTPVEEQARMLQQSGTEFLQAKFKQRPLKKAPASPATKQKPAKGNFMLKSILSVAPKKE